MGWEVHRERHEFSLVLDPVSFSEAVDSKKVKARAIIALFIGKLREFLDRGDRELLDSTRTECAVCGKFYSDSFTVYSGNYLEFKGNKKKTLKPMCRHCFQEAKYYLEDYKRGK